LALYEGERIRDRAAVERLRNRQLVFRRLLHRQVGWLFPSICGRHNPPRGGTDHHPLDRGDIKDLITSMDDAIDQMNQTASGAGSPSKPEEFLCGTEAGLRSLAAG
jgi:hypothetical protein